MCIDQAHLHTVRLQPCDERSWGPLRARSGPRLGRRSDISNQREGQVTFQLCANSAISILH